MSDIGDSLRRENDYFRAREDQPNVDHEKPSSKSELLQEHIANFPQTAEQVAQEALDIQMGSVEDAIHLVEDMPDGELKSEVLRILEEKNEV